MSALPNLLKLFSIFALSSGLANTLLGIDLIPYETHTAPIKITPTTRTISQRTTLSDKDEKSTSTSTSSPTSSISPPNTSSDPTYHPSIHNGLVLTDSQLRFSAACWTTFSPLLYYVSLNLHSPERLTILLILGCGIFLGGIGRAISAYRYGVAPGMGGWWSIAVAAELVGPVWFWAGGRGVWW
jgi:hypothetical protein